MSSTDSAPNWGLGTSGGAAATRPRSEPSFVSSAGVGEAAESGDMDGLGDLSYEEALSEVRDIVRSLQDGTVSVDRLLTAADRGRALLALCERRLSSAEEVLM